MVPVCKAAKDGLDNYSLLVANKTMPQAYEALKGSADVFLYPGHVNAITGTRLCEALTEEGVSGVVAGFTARELMTALAVALVKFQEGKPFFVNCYPRVVTQDGSKEAQELVDEMMEACDSEWRGLGMIPASGLQLRPEWKNSDARIKYQVPKMEGKPNPACRCGDVLQGKCKPSDCKVFGKGCTPQHPIGACMVSGKGSLFCILSVFARKEGNSMENKTVTMAHGAGGKQTSELIDQVFKAHFANADLTADDAAVLTPPVGRMAVSTDGFIVSPAFFPGGNIGKLSISGTVNDLACMGAKPLYLTCAFVIEEGFPMEKLEEIASAMEKTAKEAGVHIVSGDTKVAGKGQVDGVFITTTGIGEIQDGVTVGGELAKPGDAIIVTGDIESGCYFLLERRFWN